MKTLAAKTGNISPEGLIGSICYINSYFSKWLFQVLSQSVNTRKSFIQLSEDYHT